MESSKRSPSKQYKYSDLNSLLHATTPQKCVNVIAVVKFFRGPTKSRGTSYTMTIGLTDPSLQGGKFICTVFNDSLSHLPQISDPGDVVIFHRLVVEPYSDRSEMRGVGLPGMGFASAVVDGRSQDAPLVIRSGWTDFNATATDLARAGQLRAWYLSPDCPVEKEPPAPSSVLVTTVVTGPEVPAEPAVEQSPASSLRRLEELQTPNTYLDLVAHVLGVFQLADDPACVVLRVWDGTAPAVPMAHFDPGTETRLVHSNVLDRPRVLWLARHAHADVFVFDEHAEEAVRTGVGPGHVLLLTNVHLVLSRTRTTAHGRRCCELWLHGGGRDRFGRGVRRVSDHARDPSHTELHRRLVRLHEEKPVTRVSAQYREAQAWTLNQVLAQEPTTWKYKVTAHVSAMEPVAERVWRCLHWVCAECRFLRMFSPALTDPGPMEAAALDQPCCPRCQLPLGLEMVFQILLEDSDGWLLAHAWAQHALRLFGQYVKEPLDVVSSLECRANVSDCLRYLPGNDISAILVAYRPEGATNAEIQYQIVDTEIVL